VACHPWPGGLTFAEMGAMFPRSGGLYVFLEEANGPLPALLFGWAGLFITMTGSCPAVADDHLVLSAVFGRRDSRSGTRNTLLESRSNR
jgi:hypothetical protein